MQAAATGSSSISRRRSHNEGLVEDAEQEEAYNKLDRLAESSHQATAGARRLSASHREDHTQGTTERRMSKSNGANTDHKGKGRLLVEENGHLNDEPEAEAMKAESEAESLYDSDDESMHCSICLSIIEDRTVVQPCCHGK